MPRRKNTRSKHKHNFETFTQLLPQKAYQFTLGQTAGMTALVSLHLASFHSTAAYTRVCAVPGAVLGTEETINSE